MHDSVRFRRSLTSRPRPFAPLRARSLVPNRGGGHDSGSPLPFLPVPTMTTASRLTTTFALALLTACGKVEGRVYTELPLIGARGAADQPVYLVPATQTALVRIRARCSQMDASYREHKRLADSLAKVMRTLDYQGAAARHADEARAYMDEREEAARLVAREVAEDTARTDMDGRFSLHGGRGTYFLAVRGEAWPRVTLPLVGAVSQDVRANAGLLDGIRAGAFPPCNLPTQ
jgi:hypothetical protein